MTAAIGLIIICKSNMTIKARIINRKSVEVIDFEQETAIAEQRYQQAISTEGLPPEVLEGIEQEHLEALQRLELFIPFLRLDPPQVNETQEVIPYYEERNGAICQLWEIKENDPAKIEAMINSLKSELSSTDYQVIKAQEYALVGMVSEYDIVALSQSRQALRSQINTLQALLL